MNQWTNESILIEPNRLPICFVYTPFPGSNAENDVLPELPGDILKRTIFRAAYISLFLIITSSGAMIQCRNTPEQAMNSNQSSDPRHPKNPYYSRTDTTTLNLSDAEWRKVLSDSVYRVARNKETEYAFTGKYWDFKGIGTYYCAACGNPLFRSDAKFSSTCGWPSFFETLRSTSVKYESDGTLGMERTEVLCGRCGGHLGHIFDDGPRPTGKRYCMNSIVLDFEPDGEKK
jgi:peptide-methionine (R)-S-oxide reductase